MQRRLPLPSVDVLAAARPHSSETTTGPSAVLPGACRIDRRKLRAIDAVAKRA